MVIFCRCVPFLPHRCSAANAERRPECSVPWRACAGRRWPESGTAASACCRRPRRRRRRVREVRAHPDAYAVDLDDLGARVAQLLERVEKGRGAYAALGVLDGQPMPGPVAGSVPARMPYVCARRGRPGGPPAPGCRVRARPWCSPGRGCRSAAGPNAPRGRRGCRPARPGARSRTWCPCRWNAPGRRRRTPAPRTTRPR